MNKLKIKQDVYNQIMNTVGCNVIESGGIIGSKKDCICAFYYDVTGKCSASSYEPDVRAINEVLNKWNEQDIKFSGIVHSHKKCQRNLSYADLEYAKKVINVNGIKEILLPLVLIDDEIQLVVYKLTESEIAEEVDYIVT